MEMKGKLIKVLDQYHLYNGDKPIATTIVCNPMLLPILSLKNCQEIENGYDLDKLADEHCNRLYHEGNINWDHYRVHFKLGFQKALELLGDKKFSEEQLRRGISEGFSNARWHGQTSNEIFQSLQQTEWDVEIVTKPYTEVSEGFNLESKREPKLDADGCLILKRL